MQHHSTITPPSLHRHSTITPPSLHHHSTIALSSQAAQRVSDNDDYSPTSIEYIDFPPLGYYSNQELNVSSINFFLIYFKIFKYLRHLPRMDAIFTTISAASFDLFLFTIMAVIIFMGFASAFYVCFGMELAAWKTLGDSLGSLMRILLGDFDYPELQETNKIMAPLLFYLFIFVSFFVLLNMFIAIICDSYADVKAAQVRPRPP